MPRLLPLVVAALVGLHAPLLAQDETPTEPATSPSAEATPADPHAGTTLPLGKATQEQLGSDAAIYTFVTDKAGVLTVFVRATDQTDLAFLVTDQDGQGLPGGKADNDVGGVVGAEQLVVTLPWPGTYQVMVFAAAPCKALMGATWLAVPELKRAEDPDFSPSQGKEMALEEKLEDSIDPRAGDRWDWYWLKAEQSGALTVITRAPVGDLVLEAYAQGAYLEPLARSDDDQGEVAGNESITIQAEAGAIYRFRVLAPASARASGDVVAYKVSAGLIAE
jgi:hypothetical protein